LTPVPTCFRARWFALKADEAPRSKHPKSNPSLEAGFFMVRPAWAHTCGCKSRRELITTNEVKRNCMRATECGEEAWSVNREPMNKNRIEGVAKQGERAINREALVIKARRRRCGGCAMKVCVLTWGDLTLRLKGRRCRVGVRSQQRS